MCWQETSKLTPRLMDKDGGCKGKQEIGKTETLGTVVVLVMNSAGMQMVK